MSQGPLPRVVGPLPPAPLAPAVAEPPVAVPPVAEPPVAEPPVAEPPVAEPPVVPPPSSPEESSSPPQAATVQAAVTTRLIAILENFMGVSRTDQSARALEEYPVDSSSRHPGRVEIRVNNDFFLQAACRQPGRSSACSFVPMRRPSGHRSGGRCFRLVR